MARAAIRVFNYTAEVENTKSRRAVSLPFTARWTRNERGRGVRIMTTVDEVVCS